jgi:uncharacterized RDD family membrane protein YckC
MVIQGILVYGILWAMNLLNLNDLRSKITDIFTSTTGAILVVLLSLALIGYYIILETVLNGQTVGKKLLHIRVRKEGGFAPNFWDILLRNIIRLVDYLPLFYGIGFIVMFFNGRSKRLGDYAAGTIVIREQPRKKITQFLNVQEVMTIQDPEPVAAESQYAWLSGLLPFLTQTDYLLIKELLNRKNDLTNGPDLAMGIMNSLIKRAYPVDPPPCNRQDVLIILKELMGLYDRASLR